MAGEIPNLVSDYVPAITGLRRVFPAEVFTGLSEIIPFLVVDLQSGIIVYANPLAEKLYGYLREEMVHKPIDILMPLELRDKYKGYWNQYVKMPAIIAIPKGPALRRDGSTFEIAALAYPRALEGRLKVFVILDPLQAAATGA